MNDTDARYMLGSILLSLGIVYILSNVSIQFSAFWGFVGIFAVFEGSYYTVKYIFGTHRDITNPLITLLLGITILIFTFRIVQPSFTMVVSGISIAIGIALLISGFVFKISRKEIISGIVLIGFGLLIATPILFNISEQFYRYLRIYGVGLLLVLLGIVVMLPRGKKTKKEEMKEETSDEMH
jgi:hypothetical protein